MKALAAAALAALFVTPAFAAESALLANEPAPLRVSTAGLDLTRSSDIRVLEARIEKAVTEACSPHGSYFATLAPQRDCRASLAVHTKPLLASLEAKAARSRMVEF